MSASVIVNMRTVVHKNSNGIVTGFPDVCKTPQPSGPPVPIPYPNIAKSQDTMMGTVTVKMDGNPIMHNQSKFSTSTGDEAGSIGGIVSNAVKGKAFFINYSFNVKVESKFVGRLGDLMLQNELTSPNTPPFPEVQPPNIFISIADVLDPDNEGWDLTSVEEASQ